MSDKTHEITKENKSSDKSGFHSAFAWLAAVATSIAAWIALGD